MHLLQAQPGGIVDGSEPVDLGQSPGDIVVLSAADGELANLAAAQGAAQGSAQESAQGSDMTCRSCAWPT